MPQDDLRFPDLLLEYQRQKQGPVYLEDIDHSSFWVADRPGSPMFIVVWLPLRVTPVTPEAHLTVLVVRVRIDAAVFPSVGEGRRLHRVFRGYIRVRSRCNPQACSTPLRSFCQETYCFRLPFTPPSSYMGELPNSHGRTLTNKSYVLHGIPYYYSS